MGKEDAQDLYKDARSKEATEGSEEGDPEGDKTRREETQASGVSVPTSAQDVAGGQDAGDHCSRHWSVPEERRRSAAQLQGESDPVSQGSEAKRSVGDAALQGLEVIGEARRQGGQ